MESEPDKRWPFPKAKRVCQSLPHATAAVIGSGPFPDALTLTLDTALRWANVGITQSRLKPQEAFPTLSPDLQWISISLRKLFEKYDWVGVIKFVIWVLCLFA